MDPLKPNTTKSTAPTDQPATFGPVAPYYDELMAGVPYKYWVDYLKSVWRRHDLIPRSILDVACGTGTVSRLLAREGYEVAGIDISEGMIAVAKQKALSENLEIGFTCQDAALLDLGDRRFDAAISLFDSLNYILDPTALQSAFAQVARHLAPGGSFLFDLNTEYALAQGMFNQSCSRKEEPLHYRWRARYDPDSQICTVNMQFSYEGADGTRVSFKEVHRQRCYPTANLREWLKQAGFATVHVYDSYSLRPPRQYSDRLFFMALK